MNSAVVLLSGGMDSTTLAYWLKRREGVKNLHALAFDYGQKHFCELEKADVTAGKLSSPIKIYRIPLWGSALVSDGEVPRGHYADEVMKATIVPNRNMILLALAAGYAVAHEVDAVAYGAQAGEALVIGQQSLYADCRPAFFKSCQETVALATDGGWSPTLIAPFLGYTKAAIIRLGEALGVPWQDTWSCYVGGETHCGTCGACSKRREAFQSAGVSDPTLYQRL